MSPIDIFAFIVLITIVLTVLGVFVFLGMLPGKIAKQRNHPQADAIAVGSWVGLIAGGVLWPLVLIWAFVIMPGQELPAQPLNTEDEGTVS